MTPRNYFDPMTEQFVAERTYACGTTAFGYGSSREEAENNSKMLISEELTGPTTELVIFERTEKTAKRGKYIWQVYAQI